MSGAPGNSTACYADGRHGFDPGAETCRCGARRLSDFGKQPAPAVAASGESVHESQMPWPVRIDIRDKHIAELDAEFSRLREERIKELREAWINGVHDGRGSRYSQFWNDAGIEQRAKRFYPDAASSRPGTAE